MTETLFEVALDALQRGNDEVYTAAHETLMSWSCKGGRQRTGWGILERSMCGLASLALWENEPASPAGLKKLISKALAGENTPDQEQRDHAARGIRERAAALRVREYALSGLEHAMNHIDPEWMRPLLKEIANLLSPDTADEPVHIHF